MKSRAIMLILLVVVGGTVASLFMLGIGLPTLFTQRTKVEPYPEEVLRSVQEEAQEELVKRGMLDKVAELGYGEQEIVLGFYGKADPEIVDIVKVIIDRKAPRVNFIIHQNVTVVLDTTPWAQEGGLAWVEERGIRLTQLQQS